VLHHNHGLLGRARLNLEWPELDVILDSLVRKLAADETLRVKDGVLRVSGDLSLGCIADQSLVLSEGDVRGGSVHALVVGNDLYLFVLPDTNA